MSPSKAIKLGMGLVTEDRKSQGLAMQLDIAANITGPALNEVTKRFLIDQDLETSIAEREITRYHIACRGPGTPVATMSGGNQQKVLVARAYLGDPALVVLDEPTRGIDVGARLRIYDDIRARAAAGVPSIVISNDAEEIATIADRAVIMRRGAIVDEIMKPTRENVYAATVS
jgi:ABC-type sugar transport system ATPase subunit